MKVEISEQYLNVGWALSPRCDRPRPKLTCRTRQVKKNLKNKQELDLLVSIVYVLWKLTEVTVTSGKPLLSSLFSFFHQTGRIFKFTAGGSSRSENCRQYQHAGRTQTLFLVYILISFLQNFSTVVKENLNATPGRAQTKNGEINGYIRILKKQPL